jgi:putative colanic acid biosynthesis UDP-glucose lipid carrier transferase
MHRIKNGSFGEGVARVCNPIVKSAAAWIVQATNPLPAALLPVMAIKEGKILLLRQVSRKPEESISVSVPVDLNKNYLFFKRSFDLLFSLLVIVGILSWLLPILALLVKLDSGGPVFFLQRRTGRRGRPFTCYKLRTMFVNGQADESPASEDDSRITRLGRFLRQSNLDELPQFFNVLAGTMSLVGPRPHMLSDCRKFSLLSPEYSFRNQVKPGITGLSQIKGLHGRPADFQTIYERCHWDVLYVRNAGFLLDLNIICMTVLLFFKWRRPFPAVSPAE